MVGTRAVMAETKLVVAVVEAPIGETLTELRDRAASRSYLWFRHSCLAALISNRPPGRATVGA